MGSDQVVTVAQRVRTEARPGIGAGSIDHSGAHGIELDVALATQQIAFGLNDAGPETPLPQRTAAIVDAIDVLHVALSQVLHQQRGPIAPARREQQVHVVGHQDIGVDRAYVARRQLLQMVEIAAVVVIGKEAGAAIVPTLDDVQWGAGNAQASATGHDVCRSSR